MNYTALASDKSIKKVTDGLTQRGFIPTVVNSGKEALEKILTLIPAGASVMNGSSRTLEEIGFIAHLKSGKHPWKNLHEQILAEKDPVKQAQLRKESVLSDYYLGSVHGIAETGEMVIASNMGSQLPHIAFTSPNVILVVSTQKITPTLSDALQRLEEHVIPLENERMLGIYNVGTMKSKTLLLHHESPFLKRKVQIVLVKEKLGF
jgi:hypothetical protein